MYQREPVGMLEGVRTHTHTHMCTDRHLVFEIDTTSLHVARPVHNMRAHRNAIFTKEIQSTTQTQPHRTDHSASSTHVHAMWSENLRPFEHTITHITNTPIPQDEPRYAYMHAPAHMRCVFR